MAEHLDSAEPDGVSGSTRAIISEATRILETVCPCLVARPTSFRLASETDRLLGLAKEVSSDPILKEYPLIKTIFTALHYAIASEPVLDSPRDLQPLDPSVRLQHAWRDKFLAPSSKAASSEVWRKQERQGVVLPFSFHSPSGTEAVLLNSEPDFRSESRMFQVKGDFLQTQY